jgi:GT2 family glycosyltransferase
VNHREPLPEVSVVMVTRNRRDQALASLHRLSGLRPAPELILVDNASTDGTTAAVEAELPHVRVLPVLSNRGACARNIGVRAARAPTVAFSDDDSWWAADALPRAAAIFAVHPRVGLVMAQVLVGEGHSVDPVCRAMSEASLGTPEGVPYPRVLGFVACGAVVRRAAFLEVGGFSDVVVFPGEEDVLALDLTAAGWELVYAADVVAHHAPQAGPERDSRAGDEIRSALLSAWLRRPLRPALALTASVARGVREPQTRRGLVEALARLPQAVRARRVTPPWVESRLRMLGR